MLNRLNNLWLQVSTATLCAMISTLVTISANAIRSPHKTSTSDRLPLIQRRQFDLLSTKIIATDFSLAQHLVNTYLKREPVARVCHQLSQMTEAAR